MTKLPTRLQNVSRRLALILRHDPGSVGLTLDPQGWVSIQTLIEAYASLGVQLTEEDIQLIVDSSDKKRFVIRESKIRANQGHSIGVDLALPSTTPPNVLYHGTSKDNLWSIYEKGLLRGSRDHVHLSIDKATAYKVGSRHGEAVILVVAAGRASMDGLTFIQSENGVWLTDHVPSKYLQKLVT